MYQSVQRIIEWRTSRITVLQSTFPSLHYFTIISLMVTMLLVFLMETDRSLILFLLKYGTCIGPLVHVHVPRYMYVIDLLRSSFQLV